MISFQSYEYAWHGYKYTHAYGLMLPPLNMATQAFSLLTWSFPTWSYLLILLFLHFENFWPCALAGMLSLTVYFLSSSSGHTRIWVSVTHSSLKWHWLLSVSALEFLLGPWSGGLGHSESPSAPAGLRFSCQASHPPSQPPLGVTTHHQLCRGSGRRQGP